MTLDRDLPDKVWNDYMLKYASTYRTFRDQDRIVYIKASQGKIGAFSIKNRLLFYTTQMLTKRKKSGFLGRIRKKLGGLYEIYQDGDFEFSLKFKEADFDSFVPFLKPYRKIQLSAAEKQIRTDRLKVSLTEKADNLTSEPEPEPEKKGGGEGA